MPIREKGAICNIYVAAGTGKSVTKTATEKVTPRREYLVSIVSVVIVTLVPLYMYIYTLYRGNSENKDYFKYMCMWVYGWCYNCYKCYIVKRKVNDV